MRKTKNYKEHLFERLQTPEDIAGYLNAAVQERDVAVFLLALRDVADARGMGKVASEAKLNRENVYRMLSEQGNPRLTSLFAVLFVLGIDLWLKPMKSRANTHRVVTAVEATLLGNVDDLEQYTPAPNQNRGSDYESPLQTNGESLAA